MSTLPLDSRLDASLPRPGIATLFGSAILEPGRLAQYIRREGVSMFTPVVLLALATAAVLAWYYTKLDYAWFGEYLRSTSPIVAKYAGKGSLHLSQAALIGPAVTTAAIGVFAVWLVTAAYLWLVGKVLRDDTTFRQWLTLSAWSSVPALVVLPLALVTIATHGDGRIAPDHLDPTTLAAIFDIAPAAAFHAAAAKVGLAGVWSALVLAIGVHRWTHLGYPRAIAIVAAPQLALLALTVIPALVS
jgi:hypothetical protein